MSTPRQPTGPSQPREQRQARVTLPVVPDHALLRAIGHGSYGEVWLAKNVMGTYRAVKVVYRSSFDDDHPYEREFEGIRKFEPISRLHESQVDILQVGRNEADGYFYYVMELADDASASSGVRNAGQKTEAPMDGKPPPPSRAPALNPETYFPRTLQRDLEASGKLPWQDCLSVSLALAGALKHLHGCGLGNRHRQAAKAVSHKGHCPGVLSRQHLPRDRR